MTLKELRQTKTWIWLAKYGMWILLAGIMLYNVYHIWVDPIGTWEKFVANLQSPWTMVAFGFIVLIPIVVGIALLYDKWVKQPQRDRFLNEWRESIKKSLEETTLMQENEVPDDESIAKYYQMYLKKFELDNRDQWNTAEPMSFEFWEKCAKDDFEEEQVGRVKWQFMIAMTSDAFMFSPDTGASTMMRYRDYESMI